MANLITTMGYYACDVTRIKKPRFGGVFFYGFPTPIRQSAGSVAEPTCSSRPQKLTWAGPQLNSAQTKVERPVPVSRPIFLGVGMRGYLRNVLQVFISFGF